jgi:hypothetical protein
MYPVIAVHFQFPLRQVIYSRPRPCHVGSAIGPHARAPLLAVANSGQQRPHRFHPPVPVPGPALTDAPVGRPRGHNAREARGTMARGERVASGRCGLSRLGWCTWQNRARIKSGGVRRLAPLCCSPSNLNLSTSVTTCQLAPLVSITSMKLLGQISP